MTLDAKINRAYFILISALDSPQSVIVCYSCKVPACSGNMNIYINVNFRRINSEVPPASFGYAPGFCSLPRISLLMLSALFTC